MGLKHLIEKSWRKMKIMFNDSHWGLLDTINKMWKLGKKE